MNNFNTEERQRESILSLQCGFCDPWRDQEGFSWNEPWPHLCFHGFGWLFPKWPGCESYVPDVGVHISSFPPYTRKRNVYPRRRVHAPYDGHLRSIEKQQQGKYRITRFLSQQLYGEITFRMAWFSFWFLRPRL